MAKAGRPGKAPIGSMVRVLINGEGGLPLRGEIERNSPEIVVVITERDPIYHGARLNPRQCKIVSQRERKAS